MNLTIAIDGVSYRVQVGDLRDRPILVQVDGETFEVWPELGDQNTRAVQSNTAVVPPEVRNAPAGASKALKAEQSPGAAQPGKDGSSKAVQAPLPGVVVSIQVEPGAQVKVGQELCVIEAMKMKNIIRANREGEIAGITVSVGQHVQHHEQLMEFAE